MPGIDNYSLDNYGLDGPGGDIESEHHLIYSKRVNSTANGTSLTKMFELGSKIALIHLYDRGSIITGVNPTSDITTNIALTATNPDGTERLIHSPSQLVTRLSNGTGNAADSRKFVISIYVDAVQKVITYYWSNNTVTNYAYFAESIPSGLPFDSLNLSLYSVVTNLGGGGYSEFSASRIVVSRLK